MGIFPPTQLQSRSDLCRGRSHLPSQRRRQALHRRRARGILRGRLGLRFRFRPDLGGPSAAVALTAAAVAAAALALAAAALALAAAALATTTIALAAAALALAAAALNLAAAALNLALAADAEACIVDTFPSKASLKTALKEFNSNAASAIAKYGPIADWCVSAITDMGYTSSIT